MAWQRSSLRVRSCTATRSPITTRRSLPAARYRDLAAIGKRYAGQGPALYPDFDEYAEYFLRDERGSTIVDPANRNFQVRPGVVRRRAASSFGWDLNQLVPVVPADFPAHRPATQPDREPRAEQL